MKNQIVSKKMRNGQSGYTLIEMAIALIILGVLLGGFTHAYSLYIRQEQIRVTDDHLKQTIAALQRFKQLNGHFPCPAPLTAPRNDVSYGTASNCSNGAATGTSPAAGATGDDGIATALSSRTDIPAPRVRIGAIPFRVLNLDENFSYDGYGSKYIYAVTEDMTQRSTFDPLRGGIGIIDAVGATMIEPANSALFTVLSPGRDRKGGYDKQGNVTLACGADIDSQNCDLGANAIFTSALESNAQGNIFDDKIIYFSELSDPMWARDENAPNQDIVDIAQGNTGIGTGDATPEAKLDIRNSGLAGQPEGTLRSSNSIRTNRVCPNNTPVGADTNCFEPRNIGGDNTSPDPGTETRPGDGMRCPSGFYMNGIMDGRPICEEVIRITCPNNSIMVGLSATGIPICRNTCAAMNRTLCGNVRTLPLTVAGGTATLTAGTTGVYTEEWLCRNTSTPTWQRQSTSGSCTCTASETTTGGHACGTGYDGTYSITRRRTCPDNIVTETNTWGPSVCTCASRPNDVQRQACPANQIGEIVTTRTWLCPQGAWSAGTVQNSCTCNVPAVRTRNLTTNNPVCPSGQTPAATPTETFDAANCRWVPDAVTCSCDSSTVYNGYRDPACEAWQHVDTQTQYTYRMDGPNCTRGQETVVNQGTCAPNLYTWQIYSSPGGNPTSDQVGPMVNASCTYSNYTSGVSQVCSTSAGSQFQAHRCTCRPAY